MRVLPIAFTMWTSDRRTIVLLRVVLNALGAAWLLYSMANRVSILGFDAVSYWLVDPSNLYRGTESSSAAGPFRYSPVIGQLVDPFGVIPWDLFFVAFLVMSLLALTVLCGRWALAFLLVPNVLGEVYLGNIDLFIALAVGFGLTYPVAWALLPLAKGTPGVVILWFLARLEWRKLAIVGAFSLGISSASLLLTPTLWTEWVRVSTQYVSGAYGASTIPAAPRLLAAAVLVIVGSRLGRRWTLAAAATLAMPGLDWKTLTVALSILPLYGLGARADWQLLQERRIAPPAGLTAER